MPQEGQRRSSALPQDMQKRAAAGFSAPQEAQPVPAMGLTIRPGGRYGKMPARL